MRARLVFRSLRIAPVLDGYRGGAPLAVRDMAGLVARFSQLLIDHPGIAEAEINPVRLLPHGVMALDARILPASG